MPLSPGSHVGPYEILSRIGAGGMGEVFRARDTRLGRTVAVKALPSQFAQNTQLKLRLQREAKAISSLTHPHICALYDIGQDDGVDYLVMEYLEGETLAERLSKGQLAIDEALRYAIEIAEALEVAHRENIVHRDLKPGNVILTKGGAKLLDFGLARTAEQAAVSADAPTVRATDPLTAEGTIVGTFQYMAPEQLEGIAADARTDIFAFGAVLYEMVTGKRAFDGKTKTSLIAAIIAGSPPPISSLRPITPPELEHVVQRCLEKDPDARWQSAHDIRLELEWIRRQLAAPAAVARRRPAILPWIITALALAAAGVFASLASRSARTESTALRAHVLPPRGAAFLELMDTLTVSPDGRYVTFAVDTDDRLWVRPIDSLEAKPIEGTERSTFPFWSPDSRWIGFFAQGKLKKVGLNGVPPITICDAPRGRSGTWNEDGVILFAPTAVSGIHRVSANGGVPQPVTMLDTVQKETTHRWPVFLPDGKRFLYLAGVHSETATSDLNAVYLASLDAPQERKMILRARSNVIYTQGHLIHVKDNLLVAHPFDAKSGALRGEPFRIAEQVEYDAEYFRGAFDATPGGMVVYRMKTSPAAGRLAWVEKGKIGEPFGDELAFRQLRLSPDLQRAAATVYEPGTGLTELVVIDTRDGRTTRLSNTPNAGEQSPAWSPDGTRIVFSRHQGFGSGGDIYTIAADGSSREQLVYRQQLETLPTSWSRDGRYVLFDLADDRGGGRRVDVMLLPMDGGAPRPFLNEPRTEERAVFSPDGRWVAYITHDNGPPQVYATNFPEGTARVQIASHVTREVMSWSADGIAFVTPDDVYTVPVRIEGGRLTPGAPRKTLTIRPEIINGDVPGADRQLVALQKLDPYESAITLTNDWQQ